MDATNLNWIEKPQMEMKTSGLQYKVNSTFLNFFTGCTFAKYLREFPVQRLWRAGRSCNDLVSTIHFAKKTQIQATPDRKNPNPPNLINASKIPFWVYKNHSLETPSTIFETQKNKIGKSNKTRQNKKGKSNCCCRFQSNHRELGKRNAQFPCASHNFFSL